MHGPQNGSDLPGDYPLPPPSPPAPPTRRHRLSGLAAKEPVLEQPPCKIACPGDRRLEEKACRRPLALSRQPPTNGAPVRADASLAAAALSSSPLVSSILGTRFAERPLHRHPHRQARCQLAPPATRTSTSRTVAAPTTAARTIRSSASSPRLALRSTSRRKTSSTTRPGGPAPPLTGRSSPRPPPRPLSFQARPLSP